MRIGIDYRFLSAGVLTVNRGMGRYTQQQLREVLRQDRDNEYVLICRVGADRSLVLPEIVAAPNVSMLEVARTPATPDDDPNAPAHLLRLAEEFQEQLYRQRLDLFHATTTNMWSDTVLPHFDVCPFVVTFYDAIPLVYPHMYVRPGERVTELYIRALRLAQGASRLVAISQSARNDALNYLGFPADRIDIAYPVADPAFQPLERAKTEMILRELRARVGLRGDFVLSVPHLHHSKNTENLLAGYARVPRELRQRLPLVLVCHLLDREREDIRRKTAELGIESDVRLTGFVSEAEMVALFNAATMVVHPSRYEGFGLPVLEALQCGAPVITTTAASLPEVGGDAAMLVDPEEPQAFADAIAELAGDPARRAAMRERGLEHARSFNPERLGASTLACYQRAVMPTQPAARRLAVWTPLPPQASGIADYSAELLEELEPHYEIEVFVDDGYLPSDAMLDRHTVRHYRAFERRSQQRPFDAILYQLGASMFHWYMYDAIQRHPGVVMVHDLVWGNVLYFHLVSTGQIDVFRQELAALEGQAALEEFETIRSLPQDQINPAIQAFLRRTYMLGRIVRASRALAVQSDLEREDLLQRYGDLTIQTIDMGVRDPWRAHPGTMQTIREGLGLGRKTVVFGVFGIVHRIKRVHVCIRAFAAIAEQNPHAVLLVVGAHPDQRYREELETLIGYLGLKERVLLLGRVDLSEFDRLLLASDVIINLRFPSMKQISAIIMRALAAGKPLIVSDLPEWEFLPESVSRKAAPDEHEVPVLAEHMRRLAAEPDLRAAMADAARDYYEHGHRSADMAGRYMKLLDQVTGHTARTIQLPQKEASHMTLNHNKVCSIEDFQNPELRETIRDVFRHEMRHFSDEFPSGAEYRKYWEIAMSVRALRHFGALHRDSMVLGVGAGTETTIFYLANHAGRVFATDLYLDPGTWGTSAPGFMLYEPEKVAPYPFDQSRLVVQHMDGRVLRYPDNSFDGIFSSGSIEHFGSFEHIANAAYEMGRVLKPGGVLTISTEFRISGPPGGSGWEGCALFSADQLRSYIIAASGLEPVDELDTSVSSDTLASKRELSSYLRDTQAQLATQGRYPRIGEIVWSSYPHLVLVHNGYVFTSVHLTLRKPENYPVSDNGWARPSAATMAAVESSSPSPSETLAALRPQVASLGESAAGAASAASAAATPAAGAAIAGTDVRWLLQHWDAQRLRGWNNRYVRRLPGPLAFAARSAIRLVNFGRILGAEAQLLAALLERTESTGARLDVIEARISSLSSQMQREPEAHGMLRLAAQEMEQAIARTNQAAQEAAREAARVADERAQQFLAQTADLESRMRLATSELRYLQQQRTIDGAPEPRDESALTAAELIETIQQLEEAVPGLAAARSIELSLQGAAAEATVMAGAAFLGKRMASQGASYRMPNDLWYHFDLTPDWNRGILFAGAAARLASGGWLVIITTPEHTASNGSGRLTAAGDHTLTLASGRILRAYLWQAR